MASTPLEELTCEGSHHEMGQIQGQRFRSEREEILSKLLHNDFMPRWMRSAGMGFFHFLLKSKGFIDRKSLLARIHQHSPLQAERLQGISQGSGLSFLTMLGLASVETLSASLSYVMGCTSIGISGSRSKSNTPLLAYNHDFPQFLAPFLFVRRSRPKRGISSIQVTYPLLPGAICGVNESGVAVSLNHAFTRESFEHGVPPTFLVQEALDSCRSAQEVQTLFEKAKFSCGSMVTVVDEKGTMLGLELARGRFGVRQPKDHLILTLNEYLIDSLKEIEVPQDARFHPKKFPDFFYGLPIHYPNWERRKRFEGLLEGNGLLDVDDLKKYLRDHNHHAGSMGTICRHHPTADTIASAILYPAQRRIEVSRGYACEANYQSFVL